LWKEEQNLARQNWFDVDKAGLAKLMAGRGKAFILYELLQNAWDQNVTRVDVTIQPVPSRRAVRVVIVDDDPDGFAELAHAYTLLSESAKKANPEQRGRFNVGEKLLLALATIASIQTTKGTITFNMDGRHQSRAGRERGTSVDLEFPFTRAEYEELLAAARRVIAPVPTTVNGELLPERTPKDQFHATLPTVVADELGVLRERQRETIVSVYDPAGTTGWLYEMGIPVVETGDRYDVDIGQKVLLTLDRDNVRPSYLRAVRVAVLNAVHEQLEPERSSDAWVREACSDQRTSPAAIRCALAKRFGGEAVAYDPSDPEANKLSVADGRQVVYGRSLTALEWQQARRAGALPPAGQVTPSPKPFHPDGKPLVMLGADEWTHAVQDIIDYASWLGRELLGSSVTVQVANDSGWPFAAAYGPAGILYLNVARLGLRWFENGVSEAVNELLLHELAHHFSADHLSTEYHGALSRLGAKAIALALKEPQRFELAPSYSN
jgi:hypothetical protein